MAVRIGERVMILSSRKRGVLLSHGPVLSRVQLDDGRRLRFGNHRIVRSRGKKRRRGYSPEVVALAKANGVSCRQCAKWRRDLDGRRA